MAEQIVLNAKLQRPSVCNAIESLLINKTWFANYGEGLLKKLDASGVEIYADEIVRDLFPSAKEATKEDWATEYLGHAISVKLVDTVNRQSSISINTEQSIPNRLLRKMMHMLICSYSKLMQQLFIIMHPLALPMDLNSGLEQKSESVHKNYMLEVQWG